jgi:hypothetical protein
MTGHTDINNHKIYSLINVNKVENCALSGTVLDRTRISYVTVMKPRKMDGQNILFAE